MKTFKILKNSKSSTKGNKRSKNQKVTSNEDDEFEIKSYPR